MSQYLQATVKNPRWWITLPFVLGVLMPLVLLQWSLRLLAASAVAADKGLEKLGQALHRPVHAWWREDVQRRQGM